MAKISFDQAAIVAASLTEAACVLLAQQGTQNGASVSDPEGEVQRTFERMLRFVTKPRSADGGRIGEATSS